MKEQLEKEMIDMDRDFNQALVPRNRTDILKRYPDKIMSFGIIERSDSLENIPNLTQNKGDSLILPSKKGLFRSKSCQNISKPCPSVKIIPNPNSSLEFYSKMMRNTDQ